MGPTIVVPETAKGAERALIGYFLPPKKRAGEALGYFPNSFSTLDFSHLEGKGIDTLLTTLHNKC